MKAANGPAAGGEDREILLEYIIVMGGIMDETVLKIAMAGFFHDIGELADKEALCLSQQYIDNHSGSYLPFNGSYSHSRAAYTAAFIEQMKDQLPKQLSSPEWGEGDSFINLAADHHRPETPMQWVIALADCIANGWDLGSFKKNNSESSGNIPFTKHLYPLFDQLKGIATEENESELKIMCYPIEVFSPQTIFPELAADVLQETNNPDHVTYEPLYKFLINNMTMLMHKSENMAIWFDHFENLVMHCASSIPSTNSIESKADIPLYDHLKIVSALSTAIYIYHRDNSTLNVEAVQNYEDNKFLVINGDFQGIQKYIFEGYGSIKKYRSKILRGRSFTVSLLSELAADLLCHEIGLPSTSPILNAAGRFVIIAPNTTIAEKAVVSVEKAINDWLVGISCGETLLSLSATIASCGDFLPYKFYALWDDLDKKLEEKKYKAIDLDAYGGTAHDFIKKGIDGKIKICPVCAKRQAVATSEYYTENDKLICNICRDHIFWGTNLVKSKPQKDIKENQLFEPIYKKYQIQLSNGYLIIKLDDSIRKYWDLNIEKRSGTDKQASIKYFNLYVPVHEKDGMDKNNDESYKKGDPKTLNHIASMALTYKATDKTTGIEALGVLKADVDDMGLLMFAGLESNRFTITRLATLSRQLNQFFVVYLPDLIRSSPDFADIYTVFAGGDDLFLIGPWNRIVEFAGTLSKEFSRYTCNNEYVHLSAGISFHKAHTPIDVMARLASNELEKSKQEKDKNSLTLFSETIKWEKFFKLKDIKNEMLQMINSGVLNNAMLYRLNAFLEMAELERILVNHQREIPIGDMACTKWRFLLAYMIERNVPKALKGKMEQEGIAEEIMKTRNLMTDWLTTYRGNLKIPLWDILYNNR